MTEEQIKAKAKEQFPNDEFKQQAIIDAINWATKELQEENKQLKLKIDALSNDVPWKDILEKNEQIEELKKQLYSDNRNVFAELNNETAQSNEQLILKVADLEKQIEQEKDLSQCRFDHNEQLRETVKKARGIVHRLLVLIQKHKWWDYTVIDEARFFMSEVDRDKDND